MGIELRDCVNGIYMTEEMKKDVIENVKERTKNTVGKPACATNYTGRKGQTRRFLIGWKRNVAAAVFIALLAGAAAVPVRALVNSIVRERMEKMPQEEQNTYAEMLIEQDVAAEGFSRAYSPEEKIRYRELGQKYQEGTFPEKEVVKVATEEEAGAYEFCYVTSTDTFCLPERTLTDEELLEIIDFTMKREYSYAKHYEKEHASEVAAGKAQEQEKITANTEDGGITKQQAEEIAAQKLSALYGVSGDGFEINSYYDENTYDGRVAYCVNWSNIIIQQYYSFYIDAKDGHMSWACRSGADLSDAPPADPGKIAEQIPVLANKAQKFMNTELQETYDEIYVSYLLHVDGKAESDVRFYLAKEDGSAWEVTYLWDGTLTEIDEKKDISEKEDGKAVELWDGANYTEVTEVFQKLDAVN